MTDEYSIIGRGLFKKETNLQTFVGLKVKLSTGEAGVIEGGFGQSGKFKIRIPSEYFKTCPSPPKFQSNKTAMLQNPFPEKLVSYPKDLYKTF